MRNISTQLKKDFTEGYRATIIRLTTKDTTVYGWTDYDTELVVNGITYVPAAGLTRTNLTSTADESVSNQELTSGWVDAPENDLLAGKFDDAVVEVAFVSPRDLSLGEFIINKGNIGQVTWTADGFRADIQSHMRKLARNISFVFTANCRHQLFSSPSPMKIGYCGVSKPSYTVVGTIGSIIIDQLRFTSNGISQPDGWARGGTITFSSGNNAGMTFEVRRFEVGADTTIELFVPSSRSMQVGDQFELTTGCDKTLDTCKNKFNNVVNFGGFPHIQTEVQYR